MNQVHFISLKILIFFIILCGPVATTFASGKDDFDGFFYTTYSYALEHFSPLPEDVQESHLHPPSEIGFQIRFKTGAFGGAGLTALDFHAGVSRFSWNPTYGLMAGGGFKNDRVSLIVGVEGESNGRLEPQVSFLACWWWGLNVKFALERSLLRPFFDFKWLLISNSELASAEGFSTEIAHDPTFVLKPGIRLVLPLLRGEATLGIYSLGPTAIGSKEFGYFISRQNVLRPEIAAGIDLMGFEFWIRAAAVYPIRSEDPVEFLYQNPFFTHDNLTAKRSLTGEFRWHF